MRRRATAVIDGQAPLFGEEPPEPAPAVSEAGQIAAAARRRADARDLAYVPIDYPAAAAEHKKQKAALTRAVNSKDPGRILIACRDAVHAWRQPARAWPDDWSRWQCALSDSRPWNDPILLEDL